MVNDLVPEEVVIDWAVKRLRNFRSGETSGMQAEHIKGWLAAARRAEKEENAAEGETRATETGVPEQSSQEEGAYNWTIFVDLVQAVFREGKLAEEATW